MQSTENAAIEARTGAGRRFAGCFAVALCLGLLALPVLVRAAPRASAEVSVSTDRVAIEARTLERQARRLVSEARIPGLALAVVHNGEVISARGYGVVSSDSAEKITADTVFRVASLSKTFASALTAQLVRDGFLSWDSRVSQWLPAFKLADIRSAENLTIAEILSHRVGLPFNALDRDLEADQPFPLLVSRLDQVPVTCAPGECYAYQNIAFSLIGDISFAATGEFYFHQVEKRLFHPLGMYTASYGRDALEAARSWARPHVRARGRWRPVRAKETYYRIPPAAGVNASVRDLAQWMNAQLGHYPDVLPADLLAALHTPQVRTPDQLRGSRWRRVRLREADYALGWRVYDYAGNTVLFHAGAVQGYRAALALSPACDFGVVLLWNSESSAPSGLLPEFLDAVFALPKNDWVQWAQFQRGRR